MSAFSSFSQTNIPAVGLITAYLGTSDPDGWVICDGVQRTDGGDGKYNNLITMGIGSGTANINYTPPNLKGSFLRGTGTDPTGNYTGPSVNTTQESSMQSHKHIGTLGITVYDPGHIHRFYTYNDDYNNGGGNVTTAPSFSMADSASLYTWYTNSVTAGVSATASVSNNSTNAANENRPYNYGTNYIIKY